MARYRHTVTGGERESTSRLGYPWQLVEQPAPPKSTKAKATKKGRRTKVEQEQEQAAEDAAEVAEQAQDEATAEAAEDAAEAAEDAKEDEQA